MSDWDMWSALQATMQGEEARRGSIRRATLRRVGHFARPHRATIVVFLVLATISAVLGVAGPVLAGRAVDAIVEQREVRVVVWLAVLIALVALADAASGCSSGASRRASARA